MKELSDNWLTEGRIDFEYKKYILLAYLQHVQGQFAEHHLYPHLADLIRHYSKLTHLKGQKEHLEQQFPRRLQGVNWRDLELLYERLESAGPVELDELYEVVEYALPKMREYLETGKERYEYVERFLRLEPIGLRPVYLGEGYLVLGVEDHPFWEVYRYQSTVFTQAQEKYRGVHLHFVKRARRRLSRTLEQLKLELVKTYQELPNPAAFVLEASKPFPMETALLPIGKRLLMRAVAA